jgi:hypothetical protein
MSSMLASDENNPNFLGAQNPDSRLAVRFYSKPIQSPFKTEKEGRPIFEDVVYVEIHTPGNQLNIIDTPARDHHKARFPHQWAHYMNAHGGDSKQMGTPLTAWTLISASQAEMLKALKFYTVEQIAFASDDQIAQVGMHAGMAPLAFRERAKRYLEAASGEASINKAAEELKKRDQEIAEMKAKHEAEMAELRALITKPEKRPYHRKAKEVVA